MFVTVKVKIPIAVKLQEHALYVAVAEFVVCVAEAVAYRRAQILRHVTMQGEL